MMNNRFFISFFISFLFFPLHGIAELTELPFPEVKCREELISVLQDWKVTGPWLAQPILTKGQPTYLAKTESVGTWAQIQLQPEGTVSATKVSSHQQTGVNWSADIRDSATSPKVRGLAATNPKDIEQARCQATWQKANRDIFSRTKNEFSDVDLKAQLEKFPQGGVIYLWSPNMEYSVRGLSAVREATKKLKLPLTVLLDPDADPASAERVRKKLGLDSSVVRANHSLELYLLGLQNHFPSLQVYKNQKTTPHMIPGLMTADGYTHVIKSELQ